MMRLALRSKRLRVLLAAVSLLLIGLVVCPAPPSAARVNPEALFNRMRAAEARASYTACAQVLAYSNGKMDLSRTAVIRRMGPKIHVDCDVPQPARLENLLQPNIPATAAGMTLRVEGEDRIAGRQCWILRLIPGSKRAHWTHLWIDKDTSMVLAFREWSEKNELIRSIKTTSVQFTR